MKCNLRTIKVDLCLGVLILFASCSKNYFEGKILYEYQYTDKQGNDITNRMKQEGDVEQHYFINPRNYKSKNQKGQLTQLYNSSTNKYYYNLGLELEEVDAGKEFPKSFESKSLPGKQIILDMPCKSLLIRTEVGSTTYFYSKKVKVNPAPFSKHRFGNWNSYLSLSKGALPLKFVVTFDRYTLTATAVAITPLKLPDKEFDVRKALEK
jgi:hypothetical protein